MSAKQHTEKDAVPEEQVVEGELLQQDSPFDLDETAEQTADTGETGDPEAHQQDLLHLQKQAQENLDKALRAQAELDNVRKRSVRDVENAHKYALEKFIVQLLPVIDSMELGINAAESVDEQSNLKEGMDLTLKMFRDALAKFGVSPVEAESQKFDPQKHEAVSMQKLEGAEPGTVTTVLQKGYELNGRLIRPAMVIVAN